MTWLMILALTTLLISGVSESILIYGFFKLPALRKYPGIFIFFQCFCQLYIEVHFITSIEHIHRIRLICKYLGALLFYIYTINWFCILFLSIEIYMKIAKPGSFNVSSRNKIYFWVTQIFSIAFFVILCVSEQNGLSGIGTCSIQQKSLYNLMWGIHIFVQMPLCLFFLALSFIISRNRNQAISSGVKYHAYVVLSFCATTAPAELYDTISLGHFRKEIENDWVGSASVLLGCMSGVLVFLSRLNQKKLRIALWNTIKCKNIDAIHNFKDFSLALLPYSTLFEQVDKNVNFNQICLSSILCCLSTIFDNKNKPFSLINSENRSWRIKIDCGKSCNAVQFNYNLFSQVLKADYITQTNLLEAFNLETNLIGIEDRYEFVSDQDFTIVTADRRFYIKSVPSECFENLKTLIKGYCNRQKNTNSHLVGIYGLFSIEYQNNYLLYFMIVENLGFELPNAKKHLISMSTIQQTDSLYYRGQAFNESVKVKKIHKKKLQYSLEEDIKILSAVNGLKYFIILVCEPDSAQYLRNKKKVVGFDDGIGYIGVSIIIEEDTKEEGSDYRDEFFKRLNELALFDNSF